MSVAIKQLCGSGVKEAMIVSNRVPIKLYLQKQIEGGGVVLTY